MKQAKWYKALFFTASLAAIIYQFQTHFIILVLQLVSVFNNPYAKLFLANSYATLDQYYHEQAEHHYKESLNLLMEKLPTAKGVQRANIEYTIGTYFKCGRGIPQDIPQAKMWILKAAKDGHPFSALELKNIENLKCTLPKK